MNLRRYYVTAVIAVDAPSAQAAIDVVASRNLLDHDGDPVTVVTDATRWHLHTWESPTRREGIALRVEAAGGLS